MAEAPSFAVVGHPNRGKSSVVATLSQNDGIAIAMEPGTTRESHAYPLTVDGNTLYTLIDTPGFQRPRKLLAWLEAHSASASDRPETVQAFYNQHRDDPQFHDECELLKPILEQNAGIIYVVDGSVPYSAANEAEMTILQWTGRPSLALINAIGSDDYSDRWENALGQYFRIVRRFNAVTAPFEQHLGLLRGFGQLEARWEQPLTAATDHLEHQRQQRQTDSADLITRALSDMLQLQVTGSIGPTESRSAAKQTLQQRWIDSQRKRERQLRQGVESIYQHHRIQRQEAELHWAGDDDLFGDHSRALWGVSRTHLATAGFGAGAISGVGVDALTLGHSLGAGALLGGIVGAAGSYYYANRLGKWSMGPLRQGHRSVRFGPAADLQFGYIVLGRALNHWYQISHRNHAGRDPVNLATTGEHWISQLGKDDQRQLQSLIQRLCKGTTDGRRHDQWIQTINHTMHAFSQWQQNEATGTSPAQSV
ncbi:MAG: GTPase [Alteromonadaceae bacterium]|nr:GTPase [Alteromonadaceae bacterium]|tara:strand:+ start:54142 stop:55581 length:1440 start_codon:yes stop_codon:yes gene_type:complete